MPKLGELQVRVCKSTGKPVLMQYTGYPCEDGKANGHKGWLCLHRERPEDDAAGVEEFNAGYSR